jgi:hypothetical protein
MSEEFRIMGFRELEKFYEENGYYADQDPRNAMNFFDTDTPERRLERINKVLDERKAIDIKEDTGGLLDALPMSREEGMKRRKEIEDEDINKAIEKGTMTRAAKGGSMSKQMELFDEGGLKDEGGTVDPVSGNEVPPGSTQEEVRDDIPAQLSEGEFVFPADVVRYLGLEFLMNLRQRAKAGLKKMEEMGQMGNSDEATLPDDIPFTVDDLEMAEGGVVEAQAGTYVAPSIPVGRVDLQNQTQQMMPPQTQQVNTPGVRTVGMAQPFRATSEPYAPTSYQQFLGPSARGAPETETRVYKHPDGRIRNVLIVKATGLPVIPGAIEDATKDGFVFEPQPLKEEVKVQPIEQQTSRVKPVVEDTGGDDDDDKTGELGGATMDVGGKSFAIGYNFDGSITLTDPKTMESRTFDKNKITKDAKAVTAGQIVELAKLTPAGIKTAFVNSALEKLNIDIPGKTKVKDIERNRIKAQTRLNKTDDPVSTDPSTGMTIDDMRTIDAGLQGKGTLTPKAGSVEDAVKSATLTDTKDESSFGTVPGTATFDQPDFTTESGSDETYSDPGTPGASAGSFGGIGDFKQGGLAKKKKPKKMKRGGLASKK